MDVAESARKQQSVSVVSGDDVFGDIRHIPEEESVCDPDTAERIGQRVSAGVHADAIACTILAPVAVRSIPHPSLPEIRFPAPAASPPIRALRQQQVPEIPDSPFASLV